MKKIAFLDRDGTLIFEPAGTKQVNGLEQVVLIKGVISALKRLQNAGFELVVVSNQDGLGTAENPTENYELINKKLKDIFASEEIYFSNWLTCPHYEEENCDCRKPKIGLVKSFENEIDKAKSVMIGDRDTDIEFAKNLGIRGFKIGENYGWKEIVDNILQRKASIKRETKETNLPCFATCSNMWLKNSKPVFISLFPLPSIFKSTAIFVSFVSLFILAFLCKILSTISFQP